MPKTIKKSKSGIAKHSRKLRNLSAFGYVFQVGAETIAVGAPLTFSNNGPLKDISHEIGSSGVGIKKTGTYNLTFSIYTNQNNPQDWAVVVNGIIQAEFNSAGQSITGSASLLLRAGDTVTILNVNTAPDPATLRTGDFVTAYLMLYRVGELR